MGNLKVCTINVCGLNNNKKKKNLSTWIQNKQIDITFLQETYCTKNFQLYCDSSWPGNIYHGHTKSSHSRGVVPDHESVVALFNICNQK